MPGLLMGRNLLKLCFPLTSPSASHFITTHHIITCLQMLLVRKHREETLDAMGSFVLSGLSFPLTDTYEILHFYILAISVTTFH